jgi:hypothetical protein
MVIDIFGSISETNIFVPFPYHAYFRIAESDMHVMATQLG